MNYSLLKTLTIISIFALCSACSFLGLDDDQGELPETTAESTAELTKKPEKSRAEKIKEASAASRRLLLEGEKAMSEGRYKTAIKTFDELDTLYPFSSDATEGQVLSALSQYRQEKYDEAVLAIDKFARLNPAHEDLPYLLYLKGQSYYEQIADVKRDQEVTALARQALQDVTNRFPDSKYARDSAFKLDLIQDHLAGKEMEIGRHYINNGNHVAALNRFKYVVENYDTTTHIPEALYRMTEIYYSMGLKDEAVRYAAVLGHNQGDSKWYRRAYDLLSDDNNNSFLPEVVNTESWFDIF